MPVAGRLLLRHKRKGNTHAERAAHLPFASRPVHVNAKENMMGTTTSSTDSASSILTIDQAAAYLAIPKATLYTWRTRRAGFGPPAVKLGTCLRYRRSDLDAWIAEHVECFDVDPRDTAAQFDTAANHTGDSESSRRGRA